MDNRIEGRTGKGHFSARENVGLRPSNLYAEEKKRNIL